MSTATPPTPPVVIQETQRADFNKRVTDPLQRLRGTIRSYVTVEGLAVLALYVALWFWIGLALDYGFFKLFGVDWVQELPWGFRAGVLIILVSGLLAVVALKVLLRLAREFRDSALALVLERRFPKVLGDRLITAVELADTRMAVKYGFSQVMIDQTIREAAEKVEQLPVHEAFNWQRLKRYGVAVAGLTAGLFVLVGAGYCALHRTGVGPFVSDFNNVAVIWFERNVLLANTIWPRQVYLEVVECRKKVGRNVASTPLKVQAIKWVVADSKAKEGWRALRWDELKPQLLGMTPPVLPADWPQGTVDQVDQYVNQTEVRQKLDEKRDESRPTQETAQESKNRDMVNAVDAVLAQLALRARDPAMARKLRMLEVPEEIMIYRKGENERSDMTLKREGKSHDYSGMLSDLKETITIRACAKDYCTPAREIEVVPPPSLSELRRQESHPAYLYHRPPAGAVDVLQGLSFLKDKKQVLPEEGVYLGGETSRIDVPAGSDLRLSGVLSKKDKALVAPVKIVPRRDRGKEGEVVNYPPVVLAADGYSFTVEFKNVSGRYDFEFEFTNTDDVSGRRHMIIQAMEDIAPEVDVQVEIIRKTPQGYLVTAKARVPFSGRVRDDRGLSQLIYGYSLAPLEGVADNRLRAIGTVNAFAPELFPVPAASHVALLGRLSAIARKIEELGEAKPEAEASAPVVSFDRLAALRDNVKPEEFSRLLVGKPPQRALPRVFEFFLGDDTPVEKLEAFDIERLLGKTLTPLQPTTGGDSAPPPRYRLKLWVSATDNNIEAKDGPRTSESKERFTFLVVTETELLSEVGKEEETLHLKFEQMIERLRDARTKLDTTVRQLKDPKFEESFFSPLATRALEVADTTAAGQVSTHEVHQDYKRILRELETNRVRKGMIDRVANLVKGLDDVKRSEFVQADDALRGFQKLLEGDKEKKLPPKFDDEAANLAKKRLDELLVRLDDIKRLMIEMENLNRLINVLRNIEEEQRLNVDRLVQLRKEIEKRIFEDLLDPKK